MRIFYMLLFCFLGNILNAQDANLYRVSTIASVKINPAYNIGENKILFSLPLLCVEVNGSMGGLSYNDIIDKSSYGSDGKLAVDLNKIYTNMDNTSIFSSGGQVNLFSFITSNQKGSFMFSVNEVFYHQQLFHKEMLDIVLNGFTIEPNESNTLAYRNKNTGPVSLDLMHYREFAFGFQRNISSDLRFGFRMKLLTGLASVSSSNAYIKSSSKSLDRLDIDVNMNVNVSAPISYELYKNDFSGSRFRNFEYNFDSSYWFNFDNLGLALDLGLEYAPSKRWLLFVSLLDLGSISYKSNVSQIYTNSKIQLEGADISNSINEDNIQYLPFDKAVQAMIEKTDSQLELKNMSHPFSQTLPLHFNFGSTYLFTKNFESYVWLNMQSYQGVFSIVPTIGLRYCYKYFRVSTNCGWRYDNPTFGFSSNLDIGNWSIYGSISNISPLTSINSPLHSSVSFGVYFVLDRHESHVY
ncbi:hypothetical protein K4L44_11060 [Halosquirtibacter laminarini]|uniref:Uncharacterized protein n=1 Tax=Halosquirtibacter laminarini TaxID=3374600 RepID=A0AC61NC98_9BACT|nr:hypothetical protein K4L44_11060 [Prolixibacteraceae bacterium]